MAEYTQETRRFGVMTKLGKDALLLRSFEGAEPMSGLFSYGLQLVSENDNIEAASLVAQPIRFWVLHPDNAPRIFHGLVNRFEYVGRGDRLSIYRAGVVPWLWFASQNRDCRIFQNMTIPQIIRKVLEDRGFKDFEDAFVKAQYPTLEYCVQYNESDFSFISRLMEAAGIFYFFRHEKNRHVMVLSDTPAACEDCKDSRVNFDDNLSERTAENLIWQWQHQYQFRPGKWTHRDYNFKEPAAFMEAQQPTLMKLPHVKDVEVYEYPGGYLQREEGLGFAKVRIQSEETQHDLVNGRSCCRSFSPGARFTLSKHHSARETGKSYIVTSVRHSMDASGQFTSGGGGSADGYENQFTCVPAETPIRPERVTPRPRVHGPQTAVVVGPPGEEIETDEYGRVKVQFHWDREGRFDQNSSCWIRVSQVHAGAGWGMMDLPRIGEEVIVSFLEGDPDR
ncbi:MAG: type VI secretion system tip protein VgrG, partial [Planctomycetaceae bacterium]|nr:type VI secretion system tip protein VgrG [Planctomycetaceae bacterium]